MPFVKTLVLACVCVTFATGRAYAQTPLVVTDAELAVPFGAAPGKLALVGSQILFVATANPESSLSIERADIARLNREGEIVTITTHRALRDAAGLRDVFRFRLTESAGLMNWYAATPAAATTSAAPEASGVLASFQVKHNHRIGSCQGTLVLTDDRLAFESISEIDDSRQWQLADIKEVEQNGIYKLKVSPFLGDTFNFVLSGKGMDSGEYRRLVDRIARARTTS